MTIALSIAAAGGCANTAQYGAGRLPYNATAQNGTGGAAENPFNMAGQRPSRRAANVPEQPPAMAATTWEQPSGTPPTTGRPAPAATAAMPPATATPPGVISPPATAAPPAAAPHQTAYYEQPATGALPGQPTAGSGTPTYPQASPGAIQQMGYTEEIANHDPFAAVEGQAASGVPVQYTAPPAMPSPSMAAPATASTAPAPTEPVPYEWGAPTMEMGAEEFLPPIRQ